MDRNAIVLTVKQFIDEHSLKTEDLYIGYETAAVLHGLITECDDVYIDITESLFDYVWCLERGVNYPGPGPNGDRVQVGKLNIHNWIVAGCEPVMIDGLQVVGRGRLIEQLQYWATLARGVDPLVRERCKAILADNKID